MATNTVVCLLDMQKRLNWNTLECNLTVTACTKNQIYNLGYMSSDCK